MSEPIKVSASVYPTEVVYEDAREDDVQLYGLYLEVNNPQFETFAIDEYLRKEDADAYASKLNEFLAKVYDRVA